MVVHSFYMTKKETKSLHKIYNSPEITPLFDEPSLIDAFNALFDTQSKRQFDSKKVKIRDIELEKKMYFIIFLTMEIIGFIKLRLMRFIR